MNKMIISNLAYRPLRSLISVFAVAIEVTLILLIVGFALGTLNDNRTRTKGTGADVLVRPPGSSNFAAFSSAPVSVKLADILRGMPHVAVVVPAVVQATNKIELINGVDLAQFEELGGPIHFLAGGPFRGPDDIIVDEYYAAANKVHIGDTVSALEHSFRVCGIVPQGRGSRTFVQLSTLQDLTGAEGKASLFYVKADDPANADAVVQEVKSYPGLENYNVMSMEDWLSVMTPKNIPMLAKFIDVVIGIATVIGFLVIFQAMYTAVMERTREIGILKSLGASKTYIVRVILRETLVLAVAGIIAGTLLSFIAAYIIRARIPTTQVQFTLSWILTAAGIAIVGAMIGALYPAYKAAQKDPVDALAYE
ncbi:MAG TPA: FtsX-like permease family protein [Candidatus Angelobacter sp.]|nr:FtsX-like permease family protein [Candidatus Angelobacter sp.]